jgi:hypothetical protein
MVGYKDRAQLLDPVFARRVNAGGGLLSPVIVAAGEVVGTWRRTLARSTVSIEPELFARPNAALRRGIADAARRYGAFLGLEPVIAETARGRRA